MASAKRIRSGGMSSEDPSHITPRTLRVHFLPELAHPHETAGNDLVVVDVLRASTTITTALHAGAANVLPCLEVPEARRQAAERTAAGAKILLGGERQGEPIAGFDYGNSPLEYTRQRVEGQTLVFTTTNGTRAMMRCVGAGNVYLGAFVNLSAVAEKLEGTANADILCAGTDGEPSLEDILFAGALVERALKLDPNRLTNDAGQLALAAWRQLAAMGDLALTLRTGQGGKNLVALNRTADIDFAAQVDHYAIVPELDLSDWMIRIAN